MSIKSNKKILIIVAVIVTAILLTFLLLIGRATKIGIYFYDVEDFSKKQIITYFESLEKIKVQINDNLEKSDLIFSYTNPLLNSDNYKSINDVNVSVLPTSMRALGVTDNKNRIGLPLQLDHIELLFRKSLIDFEDGKETFSTIGELEEILLSHVEPGFYPLMIDGKSNSSLLDLIYLLTVSYYGAEGYFSLIEYIEDGSTDDLSQIEDVLNLLINWRKAGILHSEWLNFDSEVVLSFLKDELSIATILRLSEHRKLPLPILRQHEAIPFPLYKETIYASDIPMPTMFCSVLSDSKLKNEKIDLLLSGLINNDFQKNLTFASGLGPVNSTSSVMDKQANDVRFWAAASGKIVPVKNVYYSYSNDSLDIETVNYDNFLNKVREFLLVNR